MKLQEKFSVLRGERRGILATNFYNYETLEGVLTLQNHYNSP